MAVLQVGDDVRGVDDRDVAVDQRRDLDSTVDRRQCSRVRPVEPVDCFVGEPLPLQHHAHLAGERAERIVEKLHASSRTPGASTDRDRGPTPDTF
jgi:hypothetical protein